MLLPSLSNITAAVASTKISTSYLHYYWMQDIHIIYSSPFLRCLQTAMQASLALGIQGVHLSKYLSEILTTECGMTGIPDVPCDDIDSYGVSIIESDSRDFPAYPEKATEAILR